MEILQIEEYVKTKMINILDLEFVKTKVLYCWRWKIKIGSHLRHFYFYLQKSEEADNKDMKTPREQKKYLTAQTPITMQGHTGYLTFATLPPVFVRWKRIV